MAEKHPTNEKPKEAPSSPEERDRQRQLGYEAWVLSYMQRAYGETPQISPATAARIIAKALSARDRMIAAIHKAATFDALTLLPNNTTFNEYLEKQIREAQTGKKGEVGVLDIDLDGFKLVNDTYGHTSGDQVLVQVALRLQSNIRQIAIDVPFVRRNREDQGTDDMAARLGGDEFSVVLPGLKGPVKMLEIGNRTLETINSIPYLVISMDGKSHEVQIGASIGAGLYKNGENIRDFRNRTDKARYMAKEQGKNRVVLAA